MAEPNPEKVAIVAEVKAKLEAADAAVLTDYRGIDVPGMAELRAALRAAGGDYKIYKNTLVRFAARELDLDIEDLLVGPTAIAFVAGGEDGKRGDPVPVAKALRAFAKENENLEVKGGLLGDRLLTSDDITALSKLASHEELLSKLAGGLAAPMQQMAGLMSALPREFAGLLRALIDEAPEAPEPEAAEPEAAEPEAAEPEAPEPETPESEDAASEADAPATEAAGPDADAPAEEAPDEEAPAEPAGADDAPAAEAAAETEPEPTETDDSPDPDQETKED